MKWFRLLFVLLPLSNLEAAPRGPAQQYVSAMKRVTDILVSDVTSPVAAARYYAYTSLSAYEVLSAHNPKAYPSLSATLTRPLVLDVQAAFKIKDPANLAILALWKTAAAMLPSGRRLQPAIDSLAAKLPQDGVQLVNATVKQVVAWAMQDGFLQLNNLLRYTPRRGAAFWQPTAPAFMAPVEPHWRTLRPMTLDSANQFVPLPPVAFDMDSSSPFFALVQEVYKIVLEKDPEKEAIANFWDCNPYHISQIGHVEFGTKKISPGGHWIGITGIACVKEKMPIEKTILAHTLVAVALHDAFMACWDEKYRSHRVRPETVINAHLDRFWRPLLQTPPFPEYVSGHSVASTTAALLLTRIFGDAFAFADDTEVEFGLPIRKFSSFKKAAEEASLSRLYGGIHFMDAIEQGIWQGTQVGNLVSTRLQKHLDLLAKKP
ncbi:MAG: hypothetical protein RL386_214 [Bacteroidota bacterium]